VLRDEDDRHVDPIGGDALLQLEAVEIRERNVQDQAARSDGSRVSQELHRRFEGLGLPARAADQPLEAFPQ
jgi:hypothetical protein